MYMRPLFTVSLRTNADIQRHYGEEQQMRLSDRPFMLQLCSHQVNTFTRELWLLATFATLLLLEFCDGGSKIYIRVLLSV